MKQSPIWEADSSSTDQQIRHIVQNPRVYYHNKKYSEYFKNDLEKHQYNPVLKFTPCITDTAAVSHSKLGDTTLSRLLYFHKSKKKSNS